MLLTIMVDMVFDSLRISARTRFRLALALLAGSVVFPLGIIFETVFVAW